VRNRWRSLTNEQRLGVGIATVVVLAIIGFVLDTALGYAILVVVALIVIPRLPDRKSVV